MTARVLIISYFFPPDGGPGTQRALKFAKYLWRYGWSPSVLTRTIPEQRGRWDPEDGTMLREVPATVRVHRVPAPDRAEGWARSLPVLDHPVTHAWAERAFEVARSIIRDELIDLVFVTMSPFDLAYLGRRLQTQVEVPVVYDLRDPWALDGWRVHRKRAAWNRDYDVMRLTLAQAGGVVVNTPEVRRVLRRMMPFIPERRLRVITNGYDESDFDRTVFGDYQRDPDVFRLVHTGSLHASRVELDRGLRGWIRRRVHHAPESIEPSGRTLMHLLDAVNRLKARRHPMGDRIRIVLAGHPDAAVRRQVGASGLSNQVEWTGYLAHRESVALVQKADALFLPLHGLASGRDSRIVPGKAYEYLASGRPVLACVPGGDARVLVESSSHGWCADPCDAPVIAKTLAAMHDSWAEGRLDTSVPPAWIARYERRQLAAQLAEFFDRLIVPRQRGQYRARAA